MAPQYIRQILAAIKGEINSNTIIKEDFNTPLSSIDHPDRKSIKETDLMDTLDHMNLIDIYKAFHLKGTVYTLFPSVMEHSPNWSHARPQNKPW